MTLSDTLKLIREADQTTKVAEVVPAVKQAAATPTNPLKAALDAAVTAGNVKVAAATSTPATDLEKLAAQVEASESEALLKEAQAYGAAVADGFVARLTQYGDVTNKTAAYTAPGLDQEKLASAAFEKGFEDATQTIYKVASDCFTLGYSATADLLK